MCDERCQLLAPATAAAAAGHACSFKLASPVAGRVLQAPPDLPQTAQVRARTLPGVAGRRGRRIGGCLTDRYPATRPVDSSPLTSLITCAPTRPDSSLHTLGVHWLPMDACWGQHTPSEDTLGAGCSASECGARSPPPPLDVQDAATAELHAPAKGRGVSSLPPERWCCPHGCAPLTQIRWRGARDRAPEGGGGSERAHAPSGAAADSGGQECCVQTDGSSACKWKKQTVLPAADRAPRRLSTGRPACGAGGAGGKGGRGGRQRAVAIGCSLPFALRIDPPVVRATVEGSGLRQGAVWASLGRLPS